MAGYVSVTGTQYTPIFSISHKSLNPYQRRASQHLDIILEQLDLGSAANLGYAKVTWLPDTIARVRYVAMEGVLEPIIIVKIDFQEAEKDRQLREDIEEFPDEETTQVDGYVPYLWVGIATFGHALVAGPASNINCNFWGYPVDARLYALEPEIDDTVLGSNPRGFTNSAESRPGSLRSGSWAGRVSSAFPDTNTGADQQLLIRTNSGQGWFFDQFMLDQGTFQDDDWDLSREGVANVAANSGMMATEHMDTTVTAPLAAYGDVDLPDSVNATTLPAGYWRRSIIVNPRGHTFPFGRFDQKLQVIDDLGTSSNLAHYSGGSISCAVLPGEYEISAFAHNFSCACTTAKVHVRMVLGEESGAVTIMDFFPDIGASPNDTAKEFMRDLILGGVPGTFGKCQAEPNNEFGGNGGGPGYWKSSLFVNVAAGTFRIGAATRPSPFFDFECPPTPLNGPEDPSCNNIGCAGNPVEQPAHYWDYPVGTQVNITYVENGVVKIADLREGVLWHMARVVQVDDDSHVCYVKLQGNDGADSIDDLGCRACDEDGENCVPCRPFSYGHTFRALGIDPSIPLETNLVTISPDAREAPYSVGQLCVVIGFIGTDVVPCSVLVGGPGLIVTTPHGAGQDFTHESWSLFRCPEYLPVKRRFEEYEFAAANRVICRNGLPFSLEPTPFRCSCIDGQWRCV